MRLSIEFASVLLSLVLFVPDVHAEANPPPIIVHSSETATNNASPTVTIPQQGNPLTSFTEGPQSHTGRPDEHPRHHRHATGHRQPAHAQATGRAHIRANHRELEGADGAQPQQPASTDKLKELDEALNKRLNSICRGC